jgi:hypothetical protein
MFGAKTAAHALSITGARYEHTQGVCTVMDAT